MTTDTVGRSTARRWSALESRCVDDVFKIPDDGRAEVRRARFQAGASV
jgi:hypothetical protein